MAEAQSAMDKGDMKKLLVKAKDEPVNCAVGIGKDPSTALLLLDKHKQPAALSKDLKKQFPDIKSIVFGTVQIDQQDQKLAVFSLNKSASGIARGLQKTLKPTGFTKVQIQMEDGTSEAAADEEQGDDAATPPAGAAAAPQPGDGASAAGDGGTSDAGDGGDGDGASVAGDGAAADVGDGGDGASVAGDGGAAAAGDGEDDASAAGDGGAADVGDGGAAAAGDGAAPAAGAAQPAPGGLNAGTLTQMLTSLVQQLAPAIAANPQQGQGLKTMAVQAQASLKSGDLAGAANTIDALTLALQQAGSGGASAGASAAPQAASAPATPAPPTAAATPAPPAPPTGAADPAAAQKLDKSRQVWSATRSKIESDLKQLKAAVIKSAKDTGEAAEMEKVLSSAIDPIVNQLDESLSTQLANAAAAKDAAEQQKLVQQAQATIQQYTKFIQGHKVLGHLDKNPFHPVALTKTLTASLAALSASVR